jgi:homoserine O-succinyltransferase/O-acetyltransferase
MPVAIETASADAAVTSLRERRLRRGSVRERGKRLRIGLVNNMPDAAWSATERQFAGLLDDAAEDFDIRLSLWTLETLDRQEETQRAMAGRYRTVRELRGAERDALIVTGAEPRAPDLRQEPYWRELTALFDWAEARTLSTVLSCLAAHASVLHRDGIVRRRLAAKCSGVFTTELVARHEIVEGFGPANSTPHSRWNGLDEDELAAKGYLTLTRSDRAGVDMFVRDGLSLQVFLQGHPEYDADTLAREYRRDLLRFLRGAASAPPQIPNDYFPPPLAKLLAAFAERAASMADDPGANFPHQALAMTSASWRATSVRLFRNWLAAVARRKAALCAPSSAARWGG